MNIGGHTRVFAVLGHPVAHTLSPAMHNAALRALGMDAVYVAFDVEPGRLMAALDAMAAMGFGGVNITVPLKEVAHRGLGELDDAARVLGAVNTVRFSAQGMKGFNTDGYGFLKSVEESFGAGVKGLGVFVLGAGGAGRAVAIACAMAGAGAVWLADVDRARCERVAAEIAAAAPGAGVSIAPDDAAARIRMARAADLVVQATPVGMKPADPPPLPPEAFGPGQMAVDLVYMYRETAFTRAAGARGARAVNGLGMLLHQGARAFEIWTGVQPPVQVMRAALEERVYGAAK